MADPAHETEAENAPAKGGGLPWGLLIGVALGAAIGFAAQDLAVGLGLAVAFGITFSFLSPLVRESLDTKNLTTAENSDGASSQEKDSK
ncbi:MAG: hypothetical protein AAFX09_04670 [Pseudomonadota bacterium]